MTHNLESHHSVESSNEKSFGIVFTIFFAILSLYPVIYKNDINLVLLIISMIFFTITILKSDLLYYPNKIWFEIGTLLGKIVSPLVMGIIFFSTVTPTGIAMRLLKKDLLKKKFETKKKTYWVNKSKNIGSLRNQF